MRAGMHVDFQLCLKWLSGRCLIISLHEMFAIGRYIVLVWEDLVCAFSNVYGQLTALQNDVSKPAL